MADTQNSTAAAAQAGQPTRVWIDGTPYARRKAEIGRPCACGAEGGYHALLCPQEPCPVHGRRIDQCRHAYTYKGADVPVLDPPATPAPGAIYDAGYRAGLRTGTALATPEPTHVRIGGTTYPRQPRTYTAPCSVCGVGFGELHRIGCQREPCPACGDLGIARANCLHYLDYGPSQEGGA